MESNAWGAPASADGSRVKKKVGGASLLAIGRVSPSGREGRARCQRSGCKHRSSPIEQAAISDYDCGVFTAPRFQSGAWPPLLVELAVRMRL